MVCFDSFYFKSALKQPRKFSGLFKSFLARNQLVASAVG
jgi:hypothetical protein